MGVTILTNSETTAAAAGAASAAKEAEEKLRQQNVQLKEKLRKQINVKHMLMHGATRFEPIEAVSSSWLQMA